MKKLLLLLLAIPTLCNAQNISAEKIIETLSCGDYTVLDKYFVTNELYPSIVTKNIANEKDVVVMYTNKYGISFIESQKIVIPMSILTNLRNPKGGFEWAVTEIIKSKTIKEINAIDYEFMDSSFLTYSRSTVAFEISKALHIQDITHLRRKFDDISKTEGFHNYILNKTTSTDVETHKIVVINYLISRMFWWRPEEINFPSIIGESDYY